MISFKTFLAFAVLCIAKDVASRSFPRDEPPPHEETSKMARYVVHKSDWASIGTISTQEDIKGYPFVGLKSVTDGPDSDSRGTPYMMMTKMDVSMKDVLADNKCTLFFSLAQGEFCKKMSYDPQDPRCARIMLTGSISEVDKNSEEYSFAKESLMLRHPEMAQWPNDHRFFITKMNIQQVALIDYFGGIIYVTPEDYFAAKLDDVSDSLEDNFLDFDSIKVDLIH